MKNMNNLQQKLQSAIALQKAGRIGEAEQVCRQILLTNPNQPDALHFLGLFCKGAGKLADAEKYMRQSLKANPRQPHVLSNLANLLVMLDKTDEALKCYQKATDLEPRYAEAWYNWGVILNKEEKYLDARARFKKAIQLNANDARYYTGLGLAHKGLGDIAEAISCYQQALKINPNYLNALHNLGSALRDEERHEEARDYFIKALSLKGDQFESWQGLAGSLHAMGDLDQAISAYGKLLELDPEHMESHEVLNNMLWEAEMTDRFLQSYRWAMEKRPENVKLPVKYAQSLIYAQEGEAAFNTLTAAKTRFPESSEIDHALAKLHTDAKIFESAKTSFELAISRPHDNEQYHIDFAQFLIIQGDLDYAMAQLEAAEKINPFEQKMLALKGICWHEMGDEREYWLNDYDTYVKGFHIDVPEGYSSLEAFNTDLAEVLNRLHTAQRQPLDQTLKGGTQTLGNLYTHKDKLLEKLRLGVLGAAQRYFDSLPDDPTHPVIRRMTEDFKIHGAWSVRLLSQGFHVNHVHPKGWVSGPYYVYLPDEVKNPKEGDQGGWVTFGADPLGLKDSDTPGKIIKPEVGMQVFFPSYTWHGTIPFTSEDYRITAPCDLMPA